jgi:hypothetical protein
MNISTVAFGAPCVPKNTFPEGMSAEISDFGSL